MKTHVIKLLSLLGNQEFLLCLHLDSDSFLLLIVTISGLQIMKYFSVLNKLQDRAAGGNNFALVSISCNFVIYLIII